MAGSFITFEGIDGCGKSTQLRLLASDPAPSYEDVGAALGMPIGSIGPTRGRCLAGLRQALSGARISKPPRGSYR